MYYFDQSALQELQNPDSASFQLLVKLFESGDICFLSASLVEGVAPKLLESFKILSVTGSDARKAQGVENVPRQLGLLAAERSLPSGTIVTLEATPEEITLATQSPEEALKSLDEPSEAKINMLDLRREYGQQMEGLDDRVLSYMASSAYVLGPQVKELEEKVCSYVGAKHGIGVSSGTEALVLALRALSIHREKKEYFTPDQKILTTAFTFTATGDAILRSGATPVFLDIDPFTYNLDTDQVKAYIAANPDEKIVGVIPVHLYGGACDMAPLMEMSKEHDFFVLEDVAQGFGGRYMESHLGTIGDMGTYSFFPTKNLGGMGDGGMVVTNNPELDQIVRMLIKHGGKDKYNVDHIGYNARLDTMQAAVLLERMEWIEGYTEKRQALAGAYSTALEPTGIVPPQRLMEATHVYHQYTMRVPGDKRDAMKEHLASKNVSSMVYYPIPLNEMKVFKDNRGEVYGELPETYKAVKEVLSLPMEPLQKDSETQRVLEAISTFK